MMNSSGKSTRGREDDDIEENSNSSGSKPTTDSSTTSSDVVASRGKLASRESKVVALGKLCMIILLLSVAAAAATLVFKYTDNEQEQEFGQVVSLSTLMDTIRFTTSPLTTVSLFLVEQRQFEELAEQLLTTYEINAENIVDSYETFSMHITAYAEGINATWPFVTFPVFEATATRVLEQTGAEVLIVSHFVSPEQLDDWEKYTVENADKWIGESYEYREMDAPNLTVSPYIFEFTSTFGTQPVQSPKDGYDRYSATWEVSPISVIQPMVNWDAMK